MNIPYQNMGSVWQAMRHCDNHGIHIHDDITQKMHYTSYSDLYQKVGCMATVLIERGIKSGDKILLSARTTPDFPTIWLALIWIGAVPVPLPPREALSPDAFQARLKDIVPLFSFYFCQEDEYNIIYSLITEWDVDIQLIKTNTIITLATEIIEDVYPIHALTQNDLAFIQFTSGSTSAPKGILISYSNVFSNIASIWKQIQIDPTQHRLASWLPLYHDMGLVGKFLGSVLTLSNLLLTSPSYFSKRPVNFLRYLSEYKCHYCSMTNFSLDWIIRQKRKVIEAKLDLSSLRFVGVGAEPIDVNTLKKFEDLTAPYGLKPNVISPCYGMAEATLAVTMSFNCRYKVVSDGVNTIPTVGSLVDNMQVVIKPSKTDEVGNILIKGKSVASHALINGEKTSLLDQDGWYDTHDLGRFSGDQLVIYGRKDEAFILNGENYFPYDIESAIRNTGVALRNRVTCFQSKQKYPDHKTGLVILFEARKISKEALGKQINLIIGVVASSSGLTVAKVLPVLPRTIPVTPSGKIKRTYARSLFESDRFSSNQGDF